MSRFPQFALCLALLIPGHIPLARAETLATRHDDHPAVEATGTLSLADVLEAALRHNPSQSLPEAYSREAQALQKRADSLFAGSPAIALRHQTDQWNDNRGMREWEANLEMPLWRWGERSASGQLAQRAREQAAASSEALRLRVAGQVRDSLWGLVLAEERASLAEHAWQTALTLEAEVKRRVAAGDLAKSDLLLAQDETLSRRDEYLLAWTEQQHVIKRYMTLTGLAQRPVHISEARSDKTAIDDTHPLLREAYLRMERARASVSQLEQAGNGNPQLTLGTKREREAGTGIEQDSVGIGIRLPFGGGSHAAPTLAAASTVLAEQTSHHTQLRRELELALHEAHHSIEMLQTEQELAAEQNRIASENLRMTRIAFNLGETELAVLLRIQNRAFTAEGNLSLRQLQLQHAIALYNEAVGDLP